MKMKRKNLKAALTLILAITNLMLPFEIFASGASLGSTATPDEAGEAEPVGAGGGVDIPNYANTVATLEQCVIRHNHANSNFNTVTFDVTDGYIKVEPINATVTITGHTNTVDYDGNAHSADGYDTQSSTDARYESTPALGHTFDSGTEVTLEDGQTAMQFECNRCHEHFTIINSIDEE